ncbi:conjugation with cellular fusion- protein [Metarhizium album ARSEF 1941]|uniref:Conjugation with cellular fusion-protein n=1 Tax=Metarhizium album (strain ARSEF 1941) TaxID=1081103 RepID=A0A0B2WRS7_METAS|nr:conjugation with cellular fusion- protein [Metarhizium album ARSEF 1941]KHN96728.1 conjugation with cellular fusion- protein [Metarhizium album ARSEF 1941]
MADSGKSIRSPHKASKTSSARSSTAPSGAPPNQQMALYHDSNDSDQEPAPLPRSHTPGHLASKSVNDKRARTSDVAIRQRSQSASQVASSSTSSPYPAKTSPVTNGSAEPPAEDDDKEKQRTADSRVSSSVPAGGRKAPSSSATSRKSNKVIRPPRGQHIPFPPLPDPKDAADVEPAPASGLYWSRAFVSGSPHSNLRAHTTTLIGSNIYVFGGCDTRTCFNTVYVLDADAFYWSVPHVVGDIPLPLRAMTCTAVGKKLVVFGGGDGPAYYNDVYVLDTVNFRWTKPTITGDRVPSKRRAHTACLYKNGIYVFGGGDGVRALNDIWRLDVSDPTKMSWRLISGPEKTPSSSSTAKHHRPKARGYHTANIVGSKLIIFGGSDGGECFDDVWVYDVETHVWKSVSIPVTYRRLSHTATIVGSYLFVIGGHDGSDYCNDVILLNLVTMTWDKRKVYGKPPSGRGYHGTVLHDSRLLVIGGFDGSEVFGDVSILELAVHAYYSQISHFTIEV